MRIQNMFERDIDRNINGVIKIEQNDAEVIEQELSEYVVTTELQGHFATFFDAYERALDTPTDKMGVWISGFFSSGKSHFLKMLSYLLSSQKANGKEAIDYIAPRLEDPMVEAKARRAVSVPTETILFNIDSKGPSNKDNTAIMRIFARVFFEHLGFDSNIKLARLENHIEKKGKTEAFRAAYENITGEAWVNTRSEYEFYSDDVIEALETSDALSRNEAERWFKNELDFEFSIEWIVKEIKQYVDKRTKEEGGMFRLLFMADEVGQYIGSDTSLMLNLQTLVEDLGTACGSSVWVVVTSQEAIDEITTIAGQDFSKIQGRFNTRLSLSSTGAGEVIRRRILSKNDHASDLLKVQYNQNATVLKNLYTFKGAQNDLVGYKSAPDFSSAFPFSGYQFKLMQDVINGLRNQGSSGKHLSAERSLLSGFQEVAQKLETQDEFALAPLWMFYDTVQSFLEGYHRRVIDRAAAAAQNNEGLESYDVNVLKLLFLIRWASKEMPGNVENLATLMADNMRTNRADVREKVLASLERLERENYITRNGECYQFLTDDEQEIARAISRTEVDSSVLTNKASEILFTQIFENAKVTVGPNSFPVREILDNTCRNNVNGLTLRIISGIDGSAAPSHEELILKSSQGEAIVLLSPDIDFLSPLWEAARIERYAASVVVSSLPSSQQEIVRAKQQERTTLEHKAQALLEEAIRHAEFYAGGNQISNTGTNSPKRLIENCVSKLVASTYNKLNFIEHNYADDAELISILNGTKVSVPGVENNKRALEDVKRFLQANHKRATSVSMAEVQSKYQDKPYGWREIDIAGIVAELIHTGDVRISYANNTIDPNNRTAVDYLRKASKTAQTKIEIRIHTSQSDITKVRQAIKDLCHEYNLPTDEEPLAAACKTALQNRLDALNSLLTNEYRRNRNYPGYTVVADSAQAIKNVLNVRGDASELLRAIAKASNELLDAAEDLEDVDSFFPDMQRIFDKAAQLMGRLNQDRGYLEGNSNATQAMGTIENILDNKNPYRQIANLTPAMQSLEAIHHQLLEEKRSVTEAKVADIYASIDEHGKSLNVTLSEVDQRHRARVGAVRDATSLTQLDAVAAQLTQDQSHLFSALDAEHERIHRPAPATTGVTSTTTLPPVTPTPARKVKEIQRTTAFLPKTFSSEEEIDSYLAQVRKQLVSNLNNNDAIRLV